MLLYGKKKCKYRGIMKNLKERAKQLKMDIPADVFAECRNEAEGLWADGKPKKWYYALPIIFIWLLILFFIVKAILL